MKFLPDDDPELSKYRRAFGRYRYRLRQERALKKELYTSLNHLFIEIGAGAPRKELSETVKHLMRRISPRAR